MANAPVEVLTAGVLQGIAHGFLGRRGGASTGALAGLNVGLGAGDQDDAVAENRSRAVAAVLPGAHLVTVYQVHSPDCVLVQAPWRTADRPQADAMVTKQPGVVLGIVTADCAPVLLADREAGVIGAAHAGWRGALHGVTDQTIAAMESLGARRNRIAAAVGPCIAMASYEVDAAFRDTFCAASSENAAFFAAGAPNHWQFDLSGYLLQRLKTAGIGAITALPEDTYTQPERFYSYRRATHRGEATYGRQLALIGLEGA